jgi:hypothetical protein
MHAELGIVGDPSCCDASRIYFAPQHPIGSEFQFVSADGEMYTTPVVTPIEHDEKRARIVSVSRNAKRARGLSVGVGADFLSESWWKEPVSISRWDGLEGKELYSAMLDEWNVLRGNLQELK